MVMIWPFIHAFLAALITTWDVLPPTSKAYDLVPTHIQAKLGRNATLDRVVKEWVKDTWRWGEPATNPSVALTWVNGINYTSAEVEEQAHFLSTLFGCRVRPYYNPSLGWWLKDLTRVSYMYIRAPTEDPVVTGLAKHLSMVLREVGPKGRVVHLAHSGGALLTYLVAKYHLKEEDRRRIDVINFGGARSITQKYFAKATNYYARNDPILLVNRRAMALMQQVINQTDGEVIYLKHNTSFVFLQGRAGDALTDHSLVGPTYLTALQREAAVFRRNYYRAYWFEALTIGKPPEMSWGRYLRKRTAAATGFHNFFSNSTIARRLQDSQAYKYLAYPYSYSAFRNRAMSSTNTTVLRIPRRIYKGARKRVRWAVAYLSKRENATTTAAAAAAAAALAAAKANRTGLASWFPSLVFFPGAEKQLNMTAVSNATELGGVEPPESLLARAFSSSSSLNLSTADVSLQVRRVRKAAARLTGVRAFWSREKRLQKLLQERRPLLQLPAAAPEPEPPRGWGPFFRGRARSSSGRRVLVVKGDGGMESEQEEEQEEDVGTGRLSSVPPPAPTPAPAKGKEKEAEEALAAAAAAGAVEEKEKEEAATTAAAALVVPPQQQEAAAAPAAAPEPEGEKKEGGEEGPVVAVVAAAEPAAVVVVEGTEEGAAGADAAPAPAAPVAAEPSTPSSSSSGFFFFRVGGKKEEAAANADGSTAVAVKAEPSDADPVAVEVEGEEEAVAAVGAAEPTPAAAKAAPGFFSSLFSWGSSSSSQQHKEGEPSRAAPEASEAAAPPPPPSAAAERQGPYAPSGEQPQAFSVARQAGDMVEAAKPAPAEQSPPFFSFLWGRKKEAAAVEEEAEAAAADEVVVAEAQTEEEEGEGEQEVVFAEREDWEADEDGIEEKEAQSEPEPEAEPAEPEPAVPEHEEAAPVAAALEEEEQQQESQVEEDPASAAVEQQQVEQQEQQKACAKKEEAEVPEGEAEREGIQQALRGGADKESPQP